MRYRWRGAVYHFALILAPHQLWVIAHILYRLGEGRDRDSEHQASQGAERRYLGLVRFAAGWCEREPLLQKGRKAWFQKPYAFQAPEHGWGLLPNPEVRVRENYQSRTYFPVATGWHIGQKRGNSKLS